ncbi:MAG: Gfo/Idh/MocA family oxidoreductase [Acidimicrobiia bacterium]|nr:Gfo/Idh/MocA family oxidoreductase [Acidimicrobiia bacterium]
MTTPATVDLAFAGAGWIAAVHGYAASHVPGLQITKVASRDPARASAAAERMGAEPCTYAELPADAHGVVVCTPPALHLNHALHAIERGAGVLIEKPLCTTLADADALVAAAATGGQIAYGENLLHAPIVRLALTHTAQLQAIDLVEVRALQGRPSWGDFLNEDWGGGVLFDLGVHPLAVALVLAAPAVPVEVRATLVGAADHPVDEHAEVTIHFDTGLLARVTASWRHADSPLWDAQISAPDGVVRMELLPRALLERNGVEVPLPGTSQGVPAQLEEFGYLQQIESFALDLQEHRAPTLGPAFGRSVLDLVCAAYASAGQASAWVDLPFRGSRHQTPLQLWRG